MTDFLDLSTETRPDLDKNQKYELYINFIKRFAYISVIKGYEESEVFYPVKEAKKVYFRDNGYSDYTYLLQNLSNAANVRQRAREIVARG